MESAVWKALTGDSESSNDSQVESNRDTICNENDMVSTSQAAVRKYPPAPSILRENGNCALALYGIRTPAPDSYDLIREMKFSLVFSSPILSCFLGSFFF